MILLVWYMVQIESQSTGSKVKAKTIQSYVSLLKDYLSFEYSLDLVDRTTRLGRLVKYLLSEDPLGGVRRKRGGSAAATCGVWGARRRPRRRT